MRLGLVNLLGELELWDEIEDFENGEGFSKIILEEDHIKGWLDE